MVISPCLRIISEFFKWKNDSANSWRHCRKTHYSKFLLTPPRRWRNCIAKRRAHSTFFRIRQIRSPVEISIIKVPRFKQICQWLPTSLSGKRPFLSPFCPALRHLCDEPPPEMHPTRVTPTLSPLDSSLPFLIIKIPALYCSCSTAFTMNNENQFRRILPETTHMN